MNCDGFTQDVVKPCWICSATGAVAAPRSATESSSAKVARVPPTISISVGSRRASRSPARTGARTALATSRIRVVAAAIALSSNELGHGVAGSWFPGAYARDWS